MTVLNWTALWQRLASDAVCPWFVWHAGTRADLCFCLEAAERNLDLRKNLGARQAQLEADAVYAPRVRGVAAVVVTVCMCVCARADAGRPFPGTHLLPEVVCVFVSVCLCSTVCV